MAYTDFTFYGSGYFGDTLTEETAPKWLERASDELDAITFGRLTFAFPTVEVHAVKVKKAVCAIAEALYWIDVQRRASSAQKAEDGSYHGASRRRLRSWCSPDDTAQGSDRTARAFASAHRYRTL